MYNSRNNHYRDQVLREGELPSSTPRSLTPVPSREATPPLDSESVRNKRARRETPQEDERIPLQSTEHVIYKKAEYTNKKQLKFISRLKWHPFPEKVVEETRNILADCYDKSLSAIAGSTEDNINEDFKRHLKSLARGTNKVIKSLLVPGIVEENILDPNLANTKVQLLADIKAQKLATAKDELYLEHTERILENKRKEMEFLEQQLKEEKDKLAAHSLQKNVVSQDYLYSLMMEPSSKIFEAPK